MLFVSLVSVLTGQLVIAEESGINDVHKIKLVVLAIGDPTKQFVRGVNTDPTKLIARLDEGDPAQQFARGVNTDPTKLIARLDEGDPAQQIAKIDGMSPLHQTA